MIILNEKTEAEAIIKSCKIDKTPSLAIFLMAKYYYNEKQYSDTKIYNTIIGFLNLNYPRYYQNRDYWNKKTKSTIEKIKTYPFYQIEGVNITEDELQTIQRLNDKKLERLAFTLLCIAKLNNIKKPNNYNWVNEESTEIFKTAGITCTVADRDKMINKLFMAGLIDFPTRNDNLNIQVKFINNHSKKALFITDFRKLGYEYLLYKGENYKRCSGCGILIKLPKYCKGKPDIIRYCTDCSKSESGAERRINCTDCGGWFTVSEKNHRSTRCPECQKAFRRLQKTHWQRTQRSTLEFDFS